MRIDLKDVNKTFRSAEGTDVVALQGVNASIRSGEFVTLVGPSGCGKTTLLDIVASLTKPTSGDVTLTPHGSTNGAGRPGIVFQTPVLMPWRTALENVLLPSELGQQASNRGKERKSAQRTKARELLDLVGLSDFEGKYPTELSGGMQQRVAIARALLLESTLLLMDEPFSALDEFTREQMNVEVLNIWTKRGFTTLFVTHNIFEAVFMSDRVLVMTPRPGKIVEDVTIDLPRPRNRELIGSDQFGAQVRRVRSALTTYWTEEQIQAAAEAEVT